MRRYAFRHSEDRYRHWIPLILADRINVVEGLIEDFKAGYIPNIIAERGWKVEIKHNPKGVAIKIATFAATAFIIYLTLKKRK